MRTYCKFMRHQRVFSLRTPLCFCFFLPDHYCVFKGEGQICRKGSLDNNTVFVFVYFLPLYTFFPFLFLLLKILRHQVKSQLNILMRMLHVPNVLNQLLLSQISQTPCLFLSRGHLSLGITSFTASLILQPSICDLH